MLVTFGEESCARLYCSKRHAKEANKRLTRLIGYDVELVRIRYIPGLITNEYSVHLFTLLHQRLVPHFVSDQLYKHRPST